MLKYHRRFVEDGERQRRWIDPRLRSVRVADIQAHLLRKGWKPVPPDRSHCLIFHEPTQDGNGPLCQLIPDSEDYAAYLTRIYELIADLAVIEHRYAVDVLNDILGQSAGANGIGRASTADTPKS